MYLPHTFLLLLFLGNILWSYLDHVCTLHLLASAPPVYFTKENPVLNLTRKERNFGAIATGTEVV